jgi:hypothetical protein
MMAQMCGKRVVQLAGTGLVRAAARLRGVVQEVVGEQFVEELEVACALHLFGVSPDDRLRGLAHVVLAHF